MIEDKEERFQDLRYKVKNLVPRSFMSSHNRTMFLFILLEEMGIKSYLRLEEEYEKVSKKISTKSRRGRDAIKGAYALVNNY